ncbi:MAG: hypothetical protein PVJ57_04125 [Phycisphaerae bacterium]|jgi:hypothetical protein
MNATAVTPSASISRSENDDCANAVPVALTADVPVVVYGDTTGDTEDCAALSGGQYTDQWYVLTIPEEMNLSIRYCDTDPVFANGYIVLDTTCPCSGTFIVASSYAQDCPDGNWSMYWNNLPAGTYYWPVLGGDTGCVGPYTVTFLGELPPPPPENPCEDPENPPVYYNGAPDQVNGLACERGGLIDPGPWIVDDVTLVAPTTITDLHWWAATEDEYGWDGFDDIIILADNAGAPGDVIYELNDVPNTRIATGQFPNGRPEYIYTIDGLNLFLPPGTFWIGMRPVGSTAAGRSFWQTAAPNGTTPVYFYGPYWGYNEWTPSFDVFGTDYDVAFCITGEAGEPPVGACCNDYTGDCVNDVSLADCLPPLRFTADTDCNSIQPPCGVLGACCVDLICVFTGYEAACDDAGGRFFPGEDCNAGFECPNDCEHRIDLLDCYGDGWNDNTLDVLVNGTPVLTGITLASGSGPQSYYFMAATGDTITTVYNAVGSYTEEPYYYVYDGFGSLLGQDGIVGSDCNQQPTGITVYGNCEPPTSGACCYYAGGCDLVGSEAECIDGLWLGLGSICEQCPCMVPCEPNEGEEVCYDGYDDTYNAGCNSDPPTFQPIACGETICGTSGVFAFGTSTYRDMDWYQVTLDHSSIITWSGIAEFPVAMWIKPDGCPSGDNIQFGTAPECTQLTLTTECLPAGTYIVIIAPSDWGAYPCGVKWEATLTCEECEFYGACCFGDPIQCEDLTEENCNMVGGTWYPDELCSAGFNCPGSCPDGELIIEIFTDDYPEETSWVVQRNGTGEVICSAGPLENAQTLHTWTCCIDDAGCYDFGILDSYGDGICCSYGNGYYNLYHNGTLIASGGEFEDAEWTTFIGDGCVPPTGRCCYEPWPSCVDEITEADCTALYGGDWVQDLNCVDNPCPEPGTADFEVDAPFTTATLDLCGAGDDCSPVNQSNDTEDHTYLVHIPNDGMWNFNTCLTTSGFDTWLAVGTTLCGEDVGWNDDSCSVQSEVIVYIPAGDYYVDVEGYSTCGEYILDVHEEIPCVLYCPWWAPLEQEACGDDTNGGCNMDVPAFEPIVCSETLCGTIWADGGTRDTDWFEYRATADDTMTWTVEAEFDVVIGLVETNTPGSGDCADTTGYLNPYTTGADCTPVSISVPVVTDGIYWFFVSHQTYYDYPCDTFNDYIAKLTGNECICGDLDYDGLTGNLDYQCFLAAFGSCDDGDPETPEVAPYRSDADFDGDGCITLVDYQMWVSCYREANKRGPANKVPSIGSRRVVAP